MLLKPHIFWVSKGKLARDKNAISLSGDKSFWPAFFRIIECDRPQGTHYKSLQRILTNTVEVLDPFFMGFKRLLKTQFFEKRAIFPVKKRLWLFFLILLSVTNVKERFSRVNKVTLL